MKITLSKLVFIISIGIFSISCENTSTGNLEDVKKNNIEKDSLIELPVKEVKPPLVLNYKIDSLRTKVELDSFKSKYSDAHQKVIYAINRIEARRVRVGKNLVIPDTLFSDILKYSPFPEKLEIINDIPKTVLISQRVQGFGLYENGTLIKWGPISSGKKSTPTPNGLNYGNYKAKEKVSTVNDAWLLPYYFNFMNFEGVGVHQYELPGYPASHACVRLYMDDANYIYDWATQWKLTDDGREIHKNGTPFMVFGEYDYTSPAPWFQLAENSDCNDLLDTELKTLEDYKASYDADEKNIKDFRDKEDKDNLLAMNSVK